MALKYRALKWTLFLVESSGGTEFCVGCLQRLGFNYRSACDVCNAICHDNYHCGWYTKAGLLRCRNCHASD